MTATDAATLRCMAELDWEKLWAEWTPDNQILCGIMPVLTAVRYAEMWRMGVLPFKARFLSTLQ